MTGNKILIGAVSITSSITFLALVVWLHLVEPGYDPVNQLMSELALGAHGKVMLFAFFALATALAALGWNFSIARAHPLLIFCDGLAAACFAGAGVLRLDNATEAHIALIAVAFVACGLAMYLLPSNIPLFSEAQDRWASWGLGSLVVLSVALGHSLIPMGIAQRFAAMALLIWLIVINWRLMRLSA